jgi:hypothetical protein
MSSNAPAQGKRELVSLNKTDDQVVGGHEKEYLTQGGAMKQPGRITLALFIPLAAVATLALAVRAQAPSPPPTQDETLTRSDGQITVTVTSGVVEFVPPPGYPLMRGRRD